VGAVLRAMRDMRARQALHDLTGATHAAGWADASGAVALVREDVGRHNALDKLVGALARQALSAAHGVVLVSSRASFEMVQKTAAAGVGILAAVSAPTALAVRLADSAGIALLGFLRDDDATLYSHPERITSQT
ncbi:formate dehydrogenase accessory sulfurtransferase FdhD, partial [Achromobacter xylosoxidans]